MMNRPWWRRILCALGWHAWKYDYTTGYGEFEARGCRCCPEAQARAIDDAGNPVERWQHWDYEPLENVQW